MNLLRLTTISGALEDFSKPKPDEKPPPKPESEAPAPVAEEWSEDFLAQAAAQFETNFANLLSGGDPNVDVSPELIQRKLQQMAEAAQKVLQNPTDIPTESVDFGSSISQAIQGLNQGAEGLQNPFNEEDLLKMFGNPQGDSNDLLPFMQGAFLIEFIPVNE